MEKTTHSFDDQAALMAEQMLVKGGAAGDMPTSRKQANGGMAAMAGGKQIDEDAEKSGHGGGYGMEKGQTGKDVTNEPGRQGKEPQTGKRITSEPGEEGSAAKPGTPSELDQDADEDAQHRARKPGKVGIPGGDDGSRAGAGDGSNLDQDDDEMARGRRAGQVGIAKGLKKDPSDSKAEAAVERENAKEMTGDDDEAVEKSIDADDLIKSLQTLEAVAHGSTVQAPAERRELLGKRLAEGTLSKSEMQELGTLMKASEGGAGEEPLAKSGAAEEPVAKSFQESFAEDPELSKGYEVSDFLERHSQLTAAALDEVQTRLAKSIEQHRDRSQSFNSQLAKSLMGMAKLAQNQERLIKALGSRLETVEKTPLPRKGAVSTRDILHKSADGEVGGGEQTLSRTDVMDTLEQMAKSIAVLPISGQRVDNAMALVEQTGQIPRSVLDDVIKFRKQGASA